MLNRFIDYSLLKLSIQASELKEFCATAIQHEFASVCVPPYFVPLVAELLVNSNVKTCTVIGYPLGMHKPKVKLLEAELAILKGADELDLMMNVSAFKNGDLTTVKEEITLLRKVTAQNEKILKVIIESGLMDDSEVGTICNLCAELEVDFVKTSSGYISPGAELEKVALMRSLLPDHILVKASGGIRDVQTARQFINVGAARIGTSSLLVEIDE